jgi:acyl-CoA reductase-like NAD-dependent aldehyde dehydrogenase
MIPDVDTDTLDRAAAAVAAGAGAWRATTSAERIALLDDLRPRVWREAGAMVEALAALKGIDPAGPYASEEWIGGPYAIAQAATAYAHALRDGRASVPVRVFPAGPLDRVLLNRFTATVRLASGATEAVAGRPYRVRPPAHAALVLGAGNVAAITALDLLHRLHVAGATVVVKLNPVNDVIRPFLERIFAAYIERDAARFVSGGADVGAYLTAHPAIDAVHVTGSARTHDAIVWGAGEAGARHRAAGRPVLAKPISSELGGISPLIVVPGRWSGADLRFQAENIVASKLNNAGANCIATQVLVLPHGWSGADPLVAEVADLLATLPARPDWYPGAGRAGGRRLVEVEPTSDAPLLREEAFASALAVVRLPAPDLPRYLDAAAAFANDRLPGTLGATLLADPGTLRRERLAIDRLVGALRYGAIGINVWSALGFLLSYNPWGAYPGQTLEDVGSGIGWVHDAYALEGVEKVVLQGPFRPFPRALLSREPTISPRPVWFVTSRTGTETARRMTELLCLGGTRRLLRVVASALRS